MLMMRKMPITLINTFLYAETSVKMLRGLLNVLVEKFFEA